MPPVDDQAIPSDDDIIGLFRQSYAAPWDRQRTPRGLDGAHGQATANPGSVEGILLASGGFTAWCMYHLLANGETHYEGRQNCRQIINSFNQKTAEECKNLALRIKNEVLIDRTIKTHMAGYEERLAKRRRKPLHIAVSRIGSNSFEGIDDSNTPSPPRPPSSPTRASVEASGNLEHPSAVQIAKRTEDHTLPFQNPSALNVGKIFPEYMTDAIFMMETGNADTNKAVYEASITMTFPDSPIRKQDCVMSMIIKHTKLEYLARRLFGAHTETEGEFRYLRLESGGQAWPGPELWLRRCQHEAVTLVFGKAIGKAIETSEFRISEINSGRLNTTECVTLSMPQRRDHNAMLNLVLNLSQAHQIRKMLFGR
ncbi:hypothetical protein JX265_009806 [Neoarthrinium moseri]|uniref:Uncharacterized protein n=1 Tax=Neoarthrinium moseri TaxID=1658444 RepID=A0A9P9WFA8_9PEZI|nr:hypothetical protein JX265_009806 [Neoarthrinium moseri]